MDTARPPKKSLGQNFLTSEAAVFKIVTAAKIEPGETVLEIGPGRGVLTVALLATGAKVIAIEKDRELVPMLKEKFSVPLQQGQISIFEADALELNEQNLADFGIISNSGGKYKIVANLPYYITGQFIRKFLSELKSEAQPSLMVLLLQKEVVERIVAADKKESLLSISVKAYGEPHKVTTVNRGSFFPAPNVDSAVIAIENISKNRFEKSQISEETFFKILHAGFAHKRKMLISNLNEISPREKIEKIFSDLNLSPKIRAEDLTLDNWFKLAEEFQNENQK